LDKSGSNSGAAVSLKMQWEKTMAVFFETIRKSETTWTLWRPPINKGFIVHPQEAEYSTPFQTVKYAFANGLRAGLPDFSWSKHTKMGKKLPNDHKLNQTSISYIYQTYAKYILDSHKIYQYFPFQVPPKFTQSGISSLKINHLATLSQQSDDIFEMTKKCESLEHTCT
jgi:hypothetical protein